MNENGILNFFAEKDNLSASVNGVDIIAALAALSGKCVRVKIEILPEE